VCHLRKLRQAGSRAVLVPLVMPPVTVLDEKKAALAQRMHVSGESASTIATALGVSRATVYRVLAEQTAEGD
jgi:DNA invertase Pin-like site-specific DNA recombinase